MIKKFHVRKNNVFILVQMRVDNVIIVEFYYISPKVTQAGEALVVWESDCIDRSLPPNLVMVTTLAGSV